MLEDTEAKWPSCFSEWAERIISLRDISCEGSELSIWLTLSHPMSACLDEFRPSDDVDPTGLLQLIDACGFSGRRVLHLLMKNEETAPGHAELED